LAVTKNAQLTLEEELAGRRQPTQFGRLLDELGVSLILASSLQAKGRVEQLWGHIQDRLVSELRLARPASRATPTRSFAIGAVVDEGQLLSS